MDVSSKNMKAPVSYKPLLCRIQIFKIKSEKLILQALVFMPKNINKNPYRKSIPYYNSKNLRKPSLDIIWIGAIIKSH